MESGGAVEEQVGDAQAGELGDAGAAVVEDGERERRGCPSGLGLGVGEQELERVAVAGDRVCADAKLGEQPPLKELLQQRREAGCGRRHDPPLSSSRAYRSKRWAAIAISSG